MIKLPGDFVPKRRIIDLDLHKVSLCNQGANSRADILLTKTKKEGDQSMPITYDEIIKGLTPEAGTIVSAKIKADIDEAVKKAVEPLNTELAALKKAKDQEVDPKPGETVPGETKPGEAKPEDDITKSLSPEIAAQFIALQKTVSQLKEKEADDIAKSRFAQVKALPMEESVLKAILKTADDATFNALLSASQLVEKSLGAVGKNGQGETDTSDSASASYAALEKKAKDIMVAKSVSPEVAFVQACEENPALYKAYVKGE